MRARKGFVNEKYRVCIVYLMIYQYSSSFSLCLSVCVKEREMHGVFGKPLLDEDCHTIWWHCALRCDAMLC